MGNTPSQPTPAPTSKGGLVKAPPLVKPPAPIIPPAHSPNTTYKTACTGASGACRATLGELVTVDNSYGYACGPAGGTAACGAIPGGEFINTDTSTCTWGTPYGGSGGLYGNFTCRRAANTADTKACCLDQSTGEKSCAAGVDMNNGPICNVFWQQECAGKNIMSSRCQAWAKVQPAAAAGVMNAYCNTADGLGNASCRQSCITSGQCDDGAKAYCAAAARNPDGTLTDSDAAAFCGCLTSELARPECFDNGCTKSGYKTATMRNGTDCGTLIQCTATWNISGTSNVSEQNSIIQNCSNGKSAPPPVPPPVIPPPTTSPVIPPSPPASEPTPENTTSLDDKWAALQTQIHAGVGVQLGDTAADYWPLIVLVVIGLMILVAVGLGYAFRSRGGPPGMMPFGYPGPSPGMILRPPPGISSRF